MAIKIEIISASEQSVTVGFYYPVPAQLPLTTNGGDVDLQWNAEGILQLA